MIVFNFSRQKMDLKISYHGSFHDVKDCPEPSVPEFAFIGRSNVGKSSLINRIFGRKDLAYVSKQPGKTQSINYYRVDDSFFLVDLPGYGFAKHSKKQREFWEKMNADYFLQRGNLVCVFVLIDSNIPLQKMDEEFISWLGQNHLPFSIVFTKSDRSKPIKLNRNIQNIRDELLRKWEELPPQFITSSVSGAGKDELLEYIVQLTDDLTGNERE